ncbi:MAG TPA: ureidoglycolate lyase [Beijerinckiaceae bacterium]|nr:ureidoglycolate lyase [Beijerinckiaceae bacterium]
MIRLPIRPLTREAFAPFGTVIETTGEGLTINAGFARRFNDRCKVDVGCEGGETNLSIFIARARALPLTIPMMEMHPLGSQAFLPLQDAPWLVVVCTDPDDPASYHAFACQGTQGVNYARGTWHFPLITFGEGDRFIVVDRKGPGNNLLEHDLAAHRQPIVTD